MVNANKLTLFIVILMLMGILSGVAIHAYATPTTISAWADDIMLLTDPLLRLIKMVIAPLMLSTLMVGIMRLGKTVTIGRVGGRTIVRFTTSSVLSILVGLVIVTFQHPGTGLNLAVPKGAVDTGLAVSGMSLKGFPSYTVPVSITEVIANNEILQAMVLSMLFGIAGALLSERFNVPLVVALNVVSHIMLKMTGYVMYITPLVIFAAISSMIASQGLGILLNYASPIGGYYLAVLLTSAALIAAGYMVLKEEAFRLLNMLKDPVLMVLTTSSSEAAYSKTLERLVKLGCSCNVVSFVLPIGCLFNPMDSVVYCSFVAMSTAQAYNVLLSFSEITVTMLILMLVSKGIAGVPRSAPVVLVATAPSFNIPVAGTLLLMGIDHFLDMGCSAINVSGNGIATAMLSKSEGLLIDEEVQSDWEAGKAEA